MKNMVPTFGSDEPDTEYVKKKDYDAKVLEIEKSISEKITKDDLPDHSIYALKEEIPKDYLKKEDLPEPIDTSNFVTKEEVDKFATKDQIPDLTPYLKKDELPPEKDLSEYAKKSEIPDVSEFAKKENIESDLAKKADKSDLDSLAKKSDLPDLKPYIKKENLPDFNTLATKAELELKASIGDVAKKVSIEDMEKYKSVIDEALKSKTNKSETYTRQEVKDRYVKNEIHQKDLEKKMDKVLLPDFETFAKKSDLDGLVGKECVDLRPYVKKEELKEYAKKSDLKAHETSYCMVKLLENFLPYDGGDWEFEYYMGNRGKWRIVHDTHNKLNKPDEYVYWTPFKGIFSIDFCYTCRRDTHLLKPQALQRIRMSNGWEFINWKYFDNPSAIPTGNDVTTVTFRDRAEFLVEAGVWIKFSMQFTNRANYEKRKNWIHTVGSDGGYSPTYFSITGTKRAI